MPQHERHDPHEGIDRELKRGSLELILLQLLASSDSYGTEILQRLSAESDGLLELSANTLYPVLYRLENAGWVEPRLDTAQRGNTRRVYSITPTGRRALDRLTKEWNQFSKAMAKLLRQDKESQ